MNYRALRRKALDLGVQLRDAYRAAGIDSTTHYRHSHRQGEPDRDEAARLDEAITLLAQCREDARRSIWGRVLRPMMIRLRRHRDMSTGDVEDTIGVTVNLVAKWECEMRHPNGFMMNCWAEALEAELRPIPRELLPQIDALLEAFYDKHKKAAP